MSDGTGTATTETEAVGSAALEPVGLSPRGIKIPPKLIYIVLAVALGGGGGVGAWFNLATDKDVGEAVEASQNAAIEREQKQLRLIEVNIDRLDGHEKSIKKVKKTMDSIQDVQHGQVARVEARRVTEDIPNRARREREYDRILSRNKERLKDGKEPCGSLACN